MRSAAVLFAALVVSACQEPLEFADWTIAVPDGTPVIEHPAATDEERAGNRIELEPELVITARGDDPNYAFYRPTTMAVDDAGRIYVADSSNARVQVFDASGEFVRTLGRAGQGPGEFSSVSGGFVGGPAGIAILDERVVVYDQIATKLVIWDLEGRYLDDVILSAVRPGLRIAGAPESTFIGELRDRHEDGTRSWRAVRFSAAGEPLVTYATLPSPGNFQVGRVGLASLTGRPTHAASQDGEVYVSPADEYQVVAFETDGRPRWALRIAWEREPVTQEHRDGIVNPLREQFEGLDTTGTEWPTHFAALSSLMVDGHGHLYVLPYVPGSGRGSDRRVDVYSPSGERLFSGYMADVNWETAVGDHVYDIRRDPDSGESEPVRYRIVEPF